MDIKPGSEDVGIEGKNPDGGDTDGDTFAELSLDDLGGAYARAAAAHDPETYAPPPESEPIEEESDVAEEPSGEPVHPAGVIEAALFVGHPENQALSAAQLASLRQTVPHHCGTECYSTGLPLPNQRSSSNYRRS